MDENLIRTSEQSHGSREPGQFDRHLLNVYERILCQVLDLQSQIRPGPCPKGFYCVIREMGT